MSTKYALVFVLLSATIVRDSYEWGIEGHTLVARLAQSQLTREASDWIRFLLPADLSGNLSAVATWADDILYSNTHPMGPSNLWQWSRPLHYTNTPDWNCTYDPTRDCYNDICIEGALRNYSRRAVAANLDHPQQQHAIIFLVHYVADVHQPLHAGFESDAGASKLNVYYMNTRRTLHSVWDTHIIRSRLTQNFQSNVDLYYAHLHALMLNETTDTDDRDFIQWTDESSKIVCEQVYLDENNNTMNTSVTIRLSDRYYARNIGIVEQRLAQAGRRLGALFNWLATNISILSTTTSSSSENPSSPSESSSYSSFSTALPTVGSPTTTTATSTTTTTTMTTTTITSSGRKMTLNITILVMTLLLSRVISIDLKNSLIFC